MAGYKAVKGTYDARWNLCLEIDEFGPPGTPPVTLLLFYFMSSAWWGDKYGKKEQGLIVADHASPKKIMQYTGLSQAAVYKALAKLEDDLWIEAREVSLGRLEVVLKLDQKGREARVKHRLKVLQERKKFSVRESVSLSENPFLPQRIATVSDLRKHTLRN